MSGLAAFFEQARSGFSRTFWIANVIELFDVIPRNRGYMDQRIRANFPSLPPMVGYATTAAFRSDAPPQTGDAYGSIEALKDHLDAYEGHLANTLGSGVQACWRGPRRRTSPGAPPHRVRWHSRA